MYNFKSNRKGTLTIEWFKTKITEHLTNKPVWISAF